LKKPLRKKSLNENQITKFKAKLVRNKINQRIFCDRYQLPYNMFRGAINGCKGFRMKPEYGDAINDYMNDIKPLSMPWKEIEKHIEDNTKLKENSVIIVIKSKKENEILAFLEFLSQKKLPPKNRYKIMPFMSSDYQYEWYLAIITTRKYEEKFTKIYTEYTAKNTGRKAGNTDEKNNQEGF